MKSRYAGGDAVRSSARWPLLGTSLAVLVMTASAFAGSGAAAVALIRQHPSSSLLWKTVTSSPAEVMLDWPSGAATAAVSVDGVVLTSIDDPAVVSVSVPLALPDKEAAERMITLGVTYSDADGTVLKSESVQLALVCGAGGVAARIRDPDRFFWTRADAAKAILPVMEGAASLVIGGEEVQPVPSAPGWYWWKSASPRPTLLSLTLDDGTVYGNSVRCPGGFLLFMK